MSNTLVSPYHEAGGPYASARLLIISALGAWLLLVIALGAADVFVSPRGEPPVPIAIGVIAPLAAFFIAMRASRRLRDLALHADLSWITTVHAWRFAGFGFIALATYHVLPGMFAWPAGLGDIAIGVSAPWIALALQRRPGFARTEMFALWNLLGILDLVVALGTGVASSGLASRVTGEVTTAPMAQLPLLLIPAYLVPIFVVLHSVALMQMRHLRREALRSE